MKTATAIIAASTLLLTDAFTGGKVKIDPSTRKFIDQFNRTRVFHGMNAVYKVAPWHPTLSGFDPENSLSDIDAKNLKQWGFNLVRLGVMWPGVEPGERGAYNQTYLDQIETLVTNLADQDIYVILDFHQDIWHRKFCGEGVPDYVYDICVEEEPEGTAPFPQPAVDATYPLDADGNPDIDSCLSQMFAKYYLSAEVGAGFQCLYDNKQDLWSAFAGYWKTVAARFKSTSNVIGYELINEPWAGDAVRNPRVLLPHYAEKQFLQPLYEYLHKEIRTVDDEKIIFFEGLTIDYWQSGFSAGPGGAEYNDRQAIAYHIYCPANNNDTVGIQFACAALDNEFFEMRDQDAARLGVPLLMTEFGAVEDFKSDLVALDRVAELADRHQQSWMYWEFKYFQDITTITPEGESMYGADGEVSKHKLRVLSRSYPQATAGTLQSFDFSSLTGSLSMTYNLLTALDNADTAPAADADAASTEIFLNRDIFYSNGINIELSGDGAAAVSFECPAVASANSDDAAVYNILKLQQMEPSADAAAVTVQVSACHGPGMLPGNKCSCP